MKLRQRATVATVATVAPVETFTPPIDPFASEVRTAEGAYIVLYDDADVELASGIYDGAWNLRRGFTNAWSIKLDPARKAGTATRFVIFIRETRQLMGGGPTGARFPVRVGDRPYFAANSLVMVPNPPPSSTS